MTTHHAPPRLDSQAARRALRRLPPRERAAVVLRFGERLSETQVATVLGCRPATARMLVQRGLARMRGEISRDAALPSTAPRRADRGASQ
jgi:DNA-directed RNA polymerase specialized sigma24 family protein